MKDNEFERLLNDSIKQYGSEYYHGADGPIDTSPAPAHVFRDDFLSDIVISPKKPKKPLIIKLLPVIGAAAAAVVIGICVATIVPKLTNGPAIADSSDNGISQVSFGMAVSAPYNDTSKAIGDSSTKNAVSEGNLPSHSENIKSDEYSNGGKTAYEHTSEYNGTAAEEPAEEPAVSSFTPAYSPPYTRSSIPGSVNCTVIRNNIMLTVNDSEKTKLAEYLCNIMTDDYEWYSSVPVSSAPAFANMVLTSVNEAITINGSSYRMITVMVSSDEILITAYTDNSTEYYDCDFSDRNYAGLNSFIDMISGSR